MTWAALAAEDPGPKRDWRCCLLFSYRVNLDPKEPTFVSGAPYYDLLI